jgi:hypothetical protein
MDSDPETAKPETLFDKLERLEGRATCDFLSGDYGPPATGGLPEPACRAGGTIPSSAKLTVFDLLNAESTLAERKLFALVDCVSCVLAHGGRYGSEETARLGLESVVSATIALAAVRVLAESRHGGA